MHSAAGTGSFACLAVLVVVRLDIRDQDIQILEVRLEMLFVNKYNLHLIRNWIVIIYQWFKKITSRTCSELILDPIFAITHENWAACNRRGRTPGGSRCIWRFALFIRTWLKTFDPFASSRIHHFVFWRFTGGSISTLGTTFGRWGGIGLLFWLVLVFRLFLFCWLTINKTGDEKYDTK